tara:strand:+ start:396 stop:1238 length:843 start_codon:yes stop_codon:yes gene_type:complete
MASYTYSLLDLGDGAMAAYFGTASMNAINAEQSTMYDSTYVENNMKIDPKLLKWSTNSNYDSDDYDDIQSVTFYAEESYTFPANIDGLENGSDDIFEWSYYSREINYISLNDKGYSAWFIEVENEDGETVELSTFALYEKYNLSPDSLEQLSNSEVTIVDYYTNREDEKTSQNKYQNLGATDPQVSMTTDENGDNSYSYTYMDGELAGIRTKFASPAGSTSLSLMQAMISSSVDKIYNTSNISRFNFKKTRAEALKPREVSSIDLVKDFNRPYRGTTSGY